MLKFFIGIRNGRRIIQRRYSTIVKMPSLSPTMETGGIVEWHKKVGEEISSGDLLCEVQTDKAVVGMEAEEDGILAKIIKPKDSSNITVGEPIAVIADRSEDWKVVAAVEVVGVKVTPSVETEKPKDTTKIQESKVHCEEDLSQIKIGPAAKLLLESYKLKTSQISHTGPHNILLKSDVLGHINQAGLKPAVHSTVDSASDSLPKRDPPTSSPQQPLSSYLDIPLTNMRLTIAKRLSASKSSTPHFYSTSEALIDPILNLRASLKKDGVAVSVNDFVVAACARALRLVPEVNSLLSKEGNIVQSETVDISVAVASDSGLITPIVFGADHLSLASIGTSIRALADKARHNKLQPQEFMGGTFTISNLGMFGIKEFTAIINSPQCAILAVGAAIPSLMVDPSNPGRPQTCTNMRFTLSADARIVDSAIAARFLGHVKTYLENPHLLTCQLGSDEAWGY